jgi:hypothetical protein
MKVFIIVILSLHISRTIFAMDKSDNNHELMANAIMMISTILALIFTCNL